VCLVLAFDADGPGPTGDKLTILARFGVVTLALFTIGSLLALAGDCALSTVAARAHGTKRCQRYRATDHTLPVVEVRLPLALAAAAPLLRPLAGVAILHRARTLLSLLKSVESLVVLAGKRRRAETTVLGSPGGNGAIRAGRGFNAPVIEKVLPILAANASFGGLVCSTASMLARVAMHFVVELAPALLAGLNVLGALTGDILLAFALHQVAIVTAHGASGAIGLNLAIVAAAEWAFAALAEKATKGLAAFAPYKFFAPVGKALAAKFHAAPVLEVPPVLAFLTTRDILADFAVWV